MHGISAFNIYDVTCHTPSGKLLWTARAKNRVVTAGLNKLLDATFKTGLASPSWYATPVSFSISDGSITSSSTTLTSASNPWTSADVGSTIIVRGAGATGNDLVSTITAFTNSGQVTLNDTAGTTVSGIAKAVWGARAGDTMSSHGPWAELTAYSEATRQAFTPGAISAGAVDNSSSGARYTCNTNGTLMGGVFMTDSSTKAGTSGTLYSMAPFGTGGFRSMNNGDIVTLVATLNVATA